MRDRKKIGILLLMFIIFINSYARTEFKASVLKLNINKEVALANGVDKIVVSYKITDDNGVPIRNMDKEDLKLKLDGKEVEGFVLTSDREKESEVTLSYKDLSSSKKIKFIKDSKSLKITLSKTRILADGKDEVIIGVANGDGKRWNDTASLYVNGTKMTTNTFKTTKVGKYTVLARSGKFTSGKKIVEAYEKIGKLKLEASKTEILANNVDSILFSLKGLDQANGTKKIKNFVLVDDKGRKVLWRFISV